MRLIGARVALSATSAERIDLEIRRGRIQPFGTSTDRGLELDLTGYLILPGLINAHDHLEFNLFPRLGRGPYPNATAWAENIYHPDCSPLKEHLRVPKDVRLFWGGLKNLLSGVTTVVHHNPYQPEVFEENFPVRVLKRFGWAHSLYFSPELVSRYRAVPERWPFLLHAGEGTDQSAAAEIHELERAEVLSRRTVLIHGVATDRRSAEILLRRQSSIVWCPSSNLFTLSQTLRPEMLRSGIPICLGTDSALTAQGDLASELQVARKESGLSVEEIYGMVTAQAASIFRLNRGEGKIREFGVADLLAVRDSGCNPAEALQQFCPSLVLLAGKIKLVSPDLAPRLDPSFTQGFKKIELQGRSAWLVNADVSRFRAATESILGRDFQLAGRPVQ
jgi:cytosine/adenosine deaminase-related metal-dependent hydrolase